MIKMTRIGENQRVVEIGWDKLTLEEAVYLMENHDGECWVDGDMRTIVMEE